MGSPRVDADVDIGMTSGEMALCVLKNTFIDLVEMPGNSIEEVSPVIRACKSADSLHHNVSEGLRAGGRMVIAWPKFKGQATELKGTSLLPRSIPVSLFRQRSFGIADEDPEIGKSTTPQQEASPQQAVLQQDEVPFAPAVDKVVGTVVDCAVSPCRIVENSGKDQAAGNVNHAATSVKLMEHMEGMCRPCAHFWKFSGCNKGDACERCHLCDEDDFKKYREQYKNRRRRPRHLFGRRPKQYYTNYSGQDWDRAWDRAWG